ncbi:LysR family transcriptional regulator [Kitasatospora sp. NPDC001175]|uniref:LysR family transcriptional regulator n=1 Tax=Kitasatospora sp. NPDC001175 TaxID=3157103 RepID=UPI003D00F7E1
MYRNLDVSQLRTLVTIMSAGGFRRAAEKLSLTQPAVSQHIRRLEAVLGGPVFARTGRQLELTTAGQELYGYARRIVALNDEAVARITAPHEVTEFSVGLCPQLEGALPDFLSGLVKLLPGVRPTIHLGLGEPLAARVAAGELDVALLLRPPREDGTRFLGAMRLAWFGADPGSAGGPLSLALCGEPCNLRRHLLDTLGAHDLPWQIAYEGPELAGLRAAVSVGLGVTCLLANADELWGLRRLPAGALPVPEPMPVSLAVAPQVPAGVVEVALRAAQRALRAYPITGAEPVPGHPHQAARRPGTDRVLVG